MPAPKETFTIERSLPGERLDTFLRRHFPATSRGAIQRLIEQGHIKVNGQQTKPTHSPRAGEVVEVEWPEARPAEALPEDIRLDIIYEDAALVVLNKPAGLVVHPAAGNEEHTLVNALLHHCAGQLSGIGGVARPGIVHRLDKDTSGLLVIAKTDAAHRSLAAQFADHGREGALERVYLALVWGAPPRPHGKIDAPIGRHPTSRTKMAVLPGKGRVAVTHYRVVASFGRGDRIASLIECRLETGRTHQVRVHLAHIGVPIVGDPLYAQGFKSKLDTMPEPLRSKLSKLNRQALHACGLSFTHPTTGTLLEFNSPLPDELAEIVDAFKEL